MSDEMTPERLDAILDGRDPANDDEARDMLALAGALREAAPGAGADLRSRVRALPQPQPSGRLRRLLNSGWRGRMLIAAPALSAIVAVIAVGVIGGSSDTGPNVAESTTTAATTVTTSEASQLKRSSGAASVFDGPTTPPSATTPSTPSSASTGAPAQAPAPPITLHVPTATIDARIAEIRRLVTAAQGTVDQTDQSGPPPSMLLSISLPAERSAAVLKAIANLGTGPGSRALATYTEATRDGTDAPAPEALTTLQVLVTEGP